MSQKAIMQKKIGLTVTKIFKNSFVAIVKKEKMMQNIKNIG